MCPFFNIPMALSIFPTILATVVFPVPGFPEKIIFKETSSQFIPISFFLCISSTVFNMSFIRLFTLSSPTRLSSCVSYSFILSLAVNFKSTPKSSLVSVVNSSSHTVSSPVLKAFSLTASSIRLRATRAFAKFSSTFSFWILSMKAFSPSSLSL